MATRDVPAAGQASAYKPCFRIPRCRTTQWGELVRNVFLFSIHFVVVSAKEIIV